MLSYLEENQILLWPNDRLISLEKEEKKFFSIIYQATFIFWHQSGHKYQEPEILNTFRLVYFLSLPDPNTGCFSHWWPLLGVRKLTPQKLKINFFLR